MVMDSWLEIYGHGSLLKLRQFHLPQFASVCSAGNEFQHRWEGTCDGLASCPGESVQLYSKLLALNETRFKHWPSLPFSYLHHNRTNLCNFSRCHCSSSIHHSSTPGRLSSGYSFHL